MNVATAAKDQIAALSLGFIVVICYFKKIKTVKVRTSGKINFLVTLSTDGAFFIDFSTKTEAE